MRRLAVVLLALTVGAGSLAGCGSESPQAGPSAAASLSRDEMGVKFAQCMREHGIDVPDPEPGKGPMVRITGGVSQDTVNKAMEACRQYNPMAENGRGDAQTDANNRAFAKCMRDNGVEGFPDPEPGQVGMRIDRKLAEDPDFEKAQKQCQPILSGGRG
ncbi:hypothetical protein [Dactylosporangium sp. NPDC048998]|uniref:hypothetical protein n=1 Tax=Dactylosporangium sp. NPDC048998 TaxID=3363976 RepID=UPI0037245C4E